MIILTAKLSKSKLIGIVAAAAAVLLLIIFLANRGSSGAEATGAVKLSTPESRVEYLNSCGYQVSETPIRTQEVLIPEEWNEVYTKYGAMQEAQGLPLKKYKGKRAMQYVYQVENWPEENSDPVYASILICKNKLIAAELTRAGTDSFLRPLLGT
ncbi:MAG: DUF4830 domain-containing protein [Oscillospiraceae bacterium]|nr:DUF4830 domain-containing protein [Oscillospiraceae bacterium]